MIGSDVGRVVARTNELTDAARAAAFADLVDRRVLDDAYRFATLMLGDRADAEDATHDAALAAWQRFADLRERERFEAWFGRILHNACRDRLRARRKAPLVLDPELAPPATAARFVSPDQAESIVRRDALGAGLRTLSPEHREVVILRFYFDLTIEQIAARTGAGTGTVKSRLHYALRYLRSALELGPQGRSRR
jgi:RNA polymerase sigma-70 factor (ECF subfamily)